MEKSQKEVDKVIAVSKATKEKLIEKAHIDPKKIVVLYNFVDTERFNRKNIKIDIKKEKEKLGIKPDEYVIGFVGRLAKVKGCEYLIRALPYLDFKYKCIIAGDGPERKRLEKLARKLKIQDKIIFLGYTNMPENVYVLLDVLVVPSLNESFGISVVEGQTSNVQVIGSNLPCLRELLEEKFLFKSKDSSAISKIIRVIRNYRINIQKSKLKRYNPKNYSKELELIYRE